MKAVKLFGPPGTGKTFALMNIMERELLKGVKPNRMAYLTFTVAARREAVSRAIDKFKYSYEELPYFRTLHSIAFRELGLNRSSIVRNEIVQFGEEIGMAITPHRQFDADGMGFDIPMGGLAGDKILAFDHFRRHNMLDLKTAYGLWPEDMDWFVVKRFCEAYELWKERESIYDFTDLLSANLRALPVDVVLVDESQDLSRLQWRALDVFAENADRIYMAGDDDQAIFKWAGASPEAFLERPGHPRVLNQSYRLPSRVHELASSIVAPIHNRQPKKFLPRAAKGRVTYVAQHDYVDYPKQGSVLVLYRNHFLSKDVEDNIRRLGLPYAKHDKPAPGAQWGEAIIYWERLRKGKELLTPDVETILAGMTLPAVLREVKRFDVNTKWTMRELLAAGLPNVATSLPWFEALRKIDDTEVRYLRSIIQHYGPSALTEKPRIRLSTIHAAKGAEADHVILLTDCSAKVRRQLYEGGDDERRVFYVGVTRAKSTLTVVGNHNPLFT